MIAALTHHQRSTIRITAREEQVLHHIALGLTTKEIADRLYISDHTIISHRKNLLEKLDARNVAGLIRRAFELGYLTIGHQVPNQRVHNFAS